MIEFFKILQRNKRNLRNKLNNFRVKLKPTHCLKNQFKVIIVKMMLTQMIHLQNIKTKHNKNLEFRLSPKVMK